MKNSLRSEMAHYIKSIVKQKFCPIHHSAHLLILELEPPLLSSNLYENENENCLLSEKLFVHFHVYQVLKNLMSP